MKTSLECVPCFFKQAIEAGKIAKASIDIQKKIINKVCGKLSEFPFDLPPSYMGRNIYNIVSEETKNKDPFYDIKLKSNKLALKFYSKLKQKVKDAEDGLFVAVELAVIGNIIDLGIKNSIEVEKELESFLNGECEINLKINKARFDYREFEEGLKKANLIVYIGDNAGEIVFDRILLEQIKYVWPNKEIVYIVRENPIINDALIEDAYFCGINESAKIISSGSDAPGTILKYCSKDFFEYYNKADLIISKGQGNFETLSGAGKKIYFLLRAKCPVVAKHVGCKLGDSVLKCSC